ncbi:hypothetical protein MUK42_09563 [Musa troglodytarum]|uniref:Uncharacterized protein n=1 Tax=Musa troglodytarum TaxID=320322 RepID=A0A9E7EBE5_9LILI|nr:hypothetical protein MUK42_09563 [Musa troglodytarum]
MTEGSGGEGPEEAERSRRKSLPPAYKYHPSPHLRFLSTGLIASPRKHKLHHSVSLPFLSLPSKEKETFVGLLFERSPY